MVFLFILNALITLLFSGPWQGQCWSHNGLYGTRETKRHYHSGGGGIRITFKEN